MPTVRGWSTVAVLMVCGACNCGAPQLAVIRSFTAAPTSLPLGGGSVTLAWEVEGADSTSIDQGVGDVSGLAQTGVAPVSTTTYTLTATNSHGSVSANATVEVATTGTIAGQVIGNNGQPGPLLTVTVLGMSPVTTDADGRFTVSGVGAPYDIAVESGTRNLVRVHRGVSRADPTLFLDEAFTGPHVAAVSGTLSGGTGFPLPTPPSNRAYEQRVLFTSPSEVSNSGITVSTAGALGGGARWSGPIQTTGTLHALQWERNSLSQQPITYRGYARVDNVTLTNNNVYDAQTITLGAVTDEVIGGIITPASGYATFTKSLRLALGRSHLDLLPLDLGLTNNFSYTVASGLNSYVVVASAVDTGTGNQGVAVQRPGIAPGQTSVAITLPVAPSPLAPADAATGVTTATPFQWAPTPGAVHLVRLAPTTGGAGPTFEFVVASDSTTILDLSALSKALPAATEYRWRIEARGPAATIDEAVNGTFFVDVASVERVAGVSALTTGAEWTFTTQ